MASEDRSRRDGIPSDSIGQKVSRVIHLSIRQIRMLKERHIWLKNLEREFQGYGIVIGGRCLIKKLVSREFRQMETILACVQI